MKRLSIYCSMIKIGSLLIYFLALGSCQGKYDRRFYGTYEKWDSTHTVFTQIKFHKNDRYSFYARSCFDVNSDSGKFILCNDTISFQSFNLPLLGNRTDSNRSLTKFKFLLRSNEILYIEHEKPLHMPEFIDTILVGKKKE